jgi:hypothetical protein
MYKVDAMEFMSQSNLPKVPVRPCNFSRDYRSRVQGFVSVASVYFSNA